MILTMIMRPQKSKHSIIREEKGHGHHRWSQLLAVDLVVIVIAIVMVKDGSFGRQVTDLILIPLLH